MRGVAEEPAIVENRNSLPFDRVPVKHPIVRSTPRERFMDSTSQSSTKRCGLCDRPIHPARLEALPGVTTCIDCATKYPRKVDLSHLDLSEASPINRNGFAPKD